ncbi:MAG: hypothetical protein HOV81_13725, partial [Kofleriaceae bacterium]|nr:hypothetical protein [Kofleriaceae bacterium]
DRANLAAGFRRVALVNGLILLPASAAIIVAAPEAIRVLMGPNWGETVLPFRILAFTILLRTNLKLGGILAQAAGAVNAVAIAFSVYMVAVVVGALLAIRWGLTGVAISTALAITLVSLHCCFLAMKVSGLSARQFAASHGPGLLLAATVVAVSWPLRSALVAAGLPAPVLLVVIGMVSVAVSLAIVLVWIKRGRGDFGWLASELKRKTGQRT